MVTAPTNGAAGIIPSVLHYYDRFCPDSNEQGVFDFLLTAAAVGILYKENSSISGAVKAINASRMALRGDGKHKVSLDKVIKTMRDTGRDMQDKYKETSRGGLAVNVIEC